jgi:hypothetical protein
MTTIFMILSTHALVGAVIGKNIGNPWIVIALSLIVHYAMDMIHHAEYFDDRIASIKKDGWKVILDLLVAAFLIYFFVYISQPNSKLLENIMFGVFFSLLPDGITLIYYLSGNRLFKKIKVLHALAHRYNKNPKYSPERQWNFRNARNDIIISTIAIILLFL